MVKVKDMCIENQEEKDSIFVHLNKAKEDNFDPLIEGLWEGWLKDVPDEYMDYEVVSKGQSLADLERGKMMKRAVHSISGMRQNRVCLRELL